ncbi:MAG: DUF1801 domain-containing protein [bacterium]
MLDGTPTTIADFTARLGRLHRPLIERLDELVHRAAPEAEGTIKWGMPVYSAGRNVVFLEARARDHVSLGFFRGVDLEDPEGLLEGSGTALRHISVASAEDIREEAFRRLIREAFDRAKDLD